MRFSICYKCDFLRRKGLGPISGDVSIRKGRTCEGVEERRSTNIEAKLRMA
jgi:hypothetical protein